MERLKQTIIRFTNPIKQKEIKYLRGAIINAVDSEEAILFHNHIGDQFRYKYPLIQYKRINQQATIVCLKEGTDSIGDFFASNHFDIVLGNRPVTLTIDSVYSQQYTVQLWDASFRYHLSKWLPLNQKNYRIYQSLEGVIEQTAFLEKILTGNILSFAKGIGCLLSKQLTCKIIEVPSTHLLTYKGVKMQSFNLVFQTNISLPDYIGLGKGCSQGMGIIKRIKTNKQ